MTDLLSVLTTTPTVYFVPSPTPSWTPFDAWIHLFDQPLFEEPAPIAAKMVHDILSWSGLSQRQLASAMGTTHPTVRSLAQGTSLGPRSDDARRRLGQVHSVIARLWALDRSRETVRARLARANRNGQTALDLLVAGDAVSAYSAAVSVSSGTLRLGAVRYPARPGQANMSLLDDDSADVEEQ